MILIFSGTELGLDGGLIIETSSSGFYSSWVDRVEEESVYRLIAAEWRWYQISGTATRPVTADTSSNNTSGVEWITELAAKLRNIFHSRQQE